MSFEFNVDRFLSDKPLAITLAGLEELRGRVNARLAMFEAEGAKAFLESWAAERGTPQRGRPRADAGSATGVIQIRGSISQHADACTDLIGGSSTESIGQQIDAFLADDSVSKIVLDFDSPGGIVAGAPELFQKILDARGTKPIVAVANAMMASKAYWLASAADQIFATPSAMVGSIGVWTLHQDVSKAAEMAGFKPTIIKAGKFKAMGNQWEPLTEEMQSRIQAQVDEIYDQFIHDVAQGRGVPMSTVRGGFGEGDVVSAKAAKAEGMVDGVKTLEQVIAMSFKTSQPSGMKAEAEGPEIQDDEPPAPTDAEESEAQARAVRFRARLFQHKAAAGAA